MKKLTIIAIGLCAITASAFAGGCRNNCCGEFNPCNYNNASNGAIVYEPGYYGNGWQYNNWNGGYVANQPYYYNESYRNGGYIVNEPYYYGSSWNGSYYNSSPSATYFYAR